MYLSTMSDKRVWDIVQELAALENDYAKKKAELKARLEELTGKKSARRRKATPREAPPTPVAVAATGPRAGTVSELVFARISRAGRNVTTDELKKQMPKVNEGTINTTAARLAREGKIKREGQGVYSALEGSEAAS